jgi:hypothetical protein
MPYTGGFPSGQMKWARGRYDFAVDGGAVSTIDLTSVGAIPANAVILTGFIEVDTVPTSGGSATIAVMAEGAGDLLAAAAISGAPWSTTGRKSLLPVGTGAASVKTTVARKLQATVAVAALTAGAFDVVVGYVEMPD